jgi:hypothetical protein
MGYQYVFSFRLFLLFFVCFYLTIIIIIVVCLYISKQYRFDYFFSAQLFQPTCFIFSYDSIRNSNCIGGNIEIAVKMVVWMLSLHYVTVALIKSVWRLA